MNAGPPVMLCMLNATSMTAVAPPVGMPSASSVAIDPPSELALADSAAMMPRGSPVPKRSGILRRAPRFGIGQQIGDRVTAGKDTDAGSEQRAAQQCRRIAERVAHAGEDASGVHPPPRQIGDDVVAADEIEQFRRREQSDDRRNDRNAVEQQIEPERAARGAAHAEARRCRATGRTRRRAGRARDAARAGARSASSPTAIRRASPADRA